MNLAQLRVSWSMDSQSWYNEKTVMLRDVRMYGASYYATTQISFTPGILKIQSWLLLPPGTNFHVTNMVNFNPSMDK